ncbi:hypothetical protein vseg_015298 [Gypsophila vaccaria]
MRVVPDDIMYDIFRRLPATSLVGIKCVSKEWYRVINSENFIRLQHKRTLEAPTFDDMMLVVPGCYQVGLYTNFDVPQPTNKGTLLTIPIPHIIGCCNGLVCLHLYRSNFVLCNSLNMSGGEARLVPPLGQRRWDCNDDGLEYGFGYNNISQVYKIVHIQSRANKVNVFSTGDRCWEVVKRGVPLHTSSFGAGVTTNNKLHWLLKNINKTDHERSECYTVTWDLQTQVFGKISIPSNNKSSPWVQCDLIVSIDDLLYMYLPNYDKDKVDCFAEIWVMKDYGKVESWAKLYTFDRTTLRLQTSLITYKLPDNINLNGLGLGLGQVFLTDSSRRPNEAFWYNLVDKSTTKVAVPGLRWSRDAKPWVCVTTLVSSTHFQTLTSFTKSLHDVDDNFSL